MKLVMPSRGTSYQLPFCCIQHFVTSSIDDDRALPALNDLIIELRRLSQSALESPLAMSDAVL